MDGVLRQAKYHYTRYFSITSATTKLGGLGLRFFSSNWKAKATCSALYRVLLLAFLMPTCFKAFWKGSRIFHSQTPFANIIVAIKPLLDNKPIGAIGTIELFD